MTDTLKNAAAVYRHLQATGWKVTDKTVRNHIKKRYLLPEKDGGFLIDDVDRYALRFLKKTGGDTKTDKVAVLTERKLKEELRGLKMKNDKLEAELKATLANYLTVEDHEQELAARAVYYDNGMRHRFHLIAPQIIQMVKGDQGKADELVEFLNIQHDEQLTEFVNTDHYLIIVENDEKL